MPTRAPHPEAEYLYDLYEVQGLPMEKIGEICGVSRVVVRRWLREVGIAARDASLSRQISHTKKTGGGLTYFNRTSQKGYDLLRFSLRPKRVIANISVLHMHDPITRSRFWRKVEIEIANLPAETITQIRAEIHAIVPMVSESEMEDHEQNRNIVLHREVMAYKSVGPRHSANSGRRLKFELAKAVTGREKNIASIAISAIPHYGPRCRFWEQVERSISALPDGIIAKVKAEIHEMVPMITETEIVAAVERGASGYHGTLIRTEEDDMLDTATETKPQMTETEARACIAQIKGKVEFIGFLLLDFQERGGWIVMGYRSMDECLKAEFRTSAISPKSFGTLIAQAKMARSLGVKHALSRDTVKELRKITDAETRLEIYRAVTINGVKATAAGIRSKLKELMPHSSPVLAPLPESAFIELNQNEDGDAVITLRTSAGRYNTLIVPCQKIAMFNWERKPARP